MSRKATPSPSALAATICAVQCPYCKAGTKLVTGRTIYPERPDLFRRNFWLCEPCDAYVGCHDGTTTPLGFPAKKELRLARIHTHWTFRAVELLVGGRSRAYAWLASKMQLHIDQCHIGMMDVEQCWEVDKHCAELLRRSTNADSGLEASIVRQVADEHLIDI